MAAPVQAGDILAGKYVVERVLGEGGMGVVVSATHQQLGQRVAVKFLLEEILENEEAVARFLREAQAAVRIQSEHVARVIDVGTLTSGAPYMVMEYLSGRDLAGELLARGPLPVEEAVGYVLQACEAVAEAHAVGIVHRDLKPANLFVATRADGTPLIKVLDFGISKALPQVGKVQNLTSTQSVMGSPLYMSPEQLRSTKNVDQRTDVWALGVILHELIAGSPPFKSDTVSGLVATVVTDPPPPLRAMRHDVPEPLEQLVLQCLEKNVDQRVPHVGELAAGLKPFAPRQAAVSVPRITGVLENAGFQTQVEMGSGGARVGGQTGFGQVAPARERSSRTPVFAVLAGLAGLVIATGLVIALLRGGTSAEPAEFAGSSEPAPSTQQGESPAPPLRSADDDSSSPPPATSSVNAAGSAPAPPPVVKKPPPVVQSPPPVKKPPPVVQPPPPVKKPVVDPLDGRH